jgi:hypothetical protein
VNVTGGRKLARHDSDDRILPPRHFFSFPMIAWRKP